MPLRAQGVFRLLAAVAIWVAVKRFNALTGTGGIPTPEISRPSSRIVAISFNALTGTGGILTSSDGSGIFSIRVSMPLRAQGVFRPHGFTAKTAENAVSMPLRAQGVFRQGEWVTHEISPALEVSMPLRAQGVFRRKIPSAANA